MWSGQVCNLHCIRNYSNYNIIKFQEILSYELWDDIFTKDNVNNIFNGLPNTYLKIFYSCFTKKKTQIKYNPWITQGIQISCKRKRELYWSCLIAVGVIRVAGGNDRIDKS
jgi:hypothetical protein